MTAQSRIDGAGTEGAGTEGAGLDEGAVRRVVTDHARAVDTGDLDRPAELQQRAGATPPAAAPTGPTGPSAG